MTLSFEKELLDGLNKVLGETRSTISLHEPSMTELEEEAVVDCVRSSFVSSVGEYVKKFEEVLAGFTGARHVIAVVNGTAALHAALRLVGVGPADEVIVPSLSFVATANAVSYCGAIAHFVDIDEDRIGIDVGALAAYLKDTLEKTPAGAKNKSTGRRIGAIVPMHAFGHPVDMDGLLELANGYGIPVIEDAAEALGSTYKGRHMGTLGKFGVLSFNGNKIITTGGGGAIVTDDDELAKSARHLTTTAKQPHRWAFYHNELGWNYRMPGINAALGCAQMSRLEAVVKSKRALAQGYSNAFSGSSVVRFISEPQDTKSNYWLNTVRLQGAGMEQRDRVLQAVNDAGYQCRPAWTPLHKLPMYQNCPQAPLHITEMLEKEIISLPSSAALGENIQ